MNLYANLANPPTLVCKISISSKGKIGTTTLLCWRKYSIRLLKLLNAPNKPCSKTNGSPLPSSINLNLSCCLISYSITVSSAIAKVTDLPQKINGLRYKSKLNRTNIRCGKAVLKSCFNKETHSEWDANRIYSNGKLSFEKFFQKRLQRILPAAQTYF